MLMEEATCRGRGFKAADTEVATYFLCPASCRILAVVQYFGPQGSNRDLLVGGVFRVQGGEAFR